MHNSELYHFGIKGMKWGIRRFQNKDGTLTSKGKQRYSENVSNAEKELESAKENFKKAQKYYNKKTAYGTVYNQEASDRFLKAKANIEWKKQKISDAKLRDKINNESKPVSKRRKELQQQYMKDGMSEDEAIVAAYKRDRTEKALIAIGSVAAVAAVSYFAYKHYDKNVDKILKRGTMLQNISTNSNKGVSDAFYFSSTGRDNMKYRGMYGNALSRFGSNNVYQTKIKVDNAIKVASERSASNALKELYTNDKEFANLLEEHMRGVANTLSGSYNLALKALRASDSVNNRHTFNKNVYDLFNVSLTLHDLPTSNAVNKKFYDYLSSKGYNAIMDINDKYFSGYNSSKPMIAFNIGNELVVDSRKHLELAEIGKANVIATLDTAVGSLAPFAIGGAALSIASNKYSRTVNNNRIVDEYRDEHPNTKLSYNQIIDNYYSGKEN